MAAEVSGVSFEGEPHAECGWQLVYLGDDIDSCTVADQKLDGFESTLASRVVDWCLCVRQKVVKPCERMVQELSTRINLLVRTTRCSHLSSQL